jgi:hypothetical protein
VREKSIEAVDSLWPLEVNVYTGHDLAHVNTSCRSEQRWTLADLSRAREPGLEVCPSSFMPEHSMLVDILESLQTSFGLCKI